ncbi:uncharacterized protein LOC127366708 isoform X2 [Dicentrarchus labrax]|uniref:uncharacterized protein LOC127366708 isoform X2 n=1 Tax=Dicentrarchus labrax TaxID=13489 RepID=UPI0021F5B797|nr:uncharacterized protein LOC127366708 isoform X2 [Dicentrarchus labrax]
MSNNNQSDDLCGWPPTLHNEDEALAIENAIRAAISTVMGVMCGACSRRAQEYQRIVADRDREIRRLESKLEESELKKLHVEVGKGQPECELSSSLTTRVRVINCVNSSDIDMKNESEINLCGRVGAPTQISPKCCDTTVAFPHQHAHTAEKPLWEDEGAAGELSFGCIASLIKEEPSDLEIKWEVCDGGLLDQQEVQCGAEYQHKEKPASKAMDDIATLIKEALPMRNTPATLQPILDVLQDLGVDTVEDLKFVQIDDLAGVLKPIQATKLFAHLKSFFSAQHDAAPSHSNMEEDFLSSPQTPSETPWVTSPSIPSTSRCSPGVLISSLYDSECFNSTRKLSNDWHYNFQVPWNMLPAVLRKKLDYQERPNARERREMIRIIAGEILAICKKPAKKHLSEVARKMVLAYPKSFKDIIEHEVVGSGHDSLTKQLQYRVDNCRRNATRGKQKSAPDNGSPVPENKKQRKASYGCIRWESRPVNVDTQMKKKKDMQKMFLENERNAQKIQKFISDTFTSQRYDIGSGKDTQALQEEWPYLFSLVGMKAHFKLLTGIHINEGFEEAMATKFARVLDYFQSLPLEKSRGAARQREIQAGGGPCGAVLMLLSYFKEDHARMFHMVDKTCITGASPMSAAAFMVAVDQEVIIENLANFTDALVGMFICYYIFNIHYPMELRTTMEFLQRCIFKINPDRGSKVERQEKKKSNAVNPKVLSLITRISEFEWSA